MANIIDIRSLNCPEVNTTQIVGFVSGLDPSYNGTIRKVVYTAYEGSDETGVVVFNKSTTLANGISSIEYVFSGLEADTSYYLTVKISNIEGYDPSDYVLYRSTQRTAASGGGDYSNAPSIESFTINGTSAREQTVYDKTITYKFKVTGLWEEHERESSNGKYYLRYGYAGMNFCTKDVFDKSGLAYSGSYGDDLEAEYIGKNIFHWNVPFGSSTNVTFTQKDLDDNQYTFSELGTYVIIFYATNENENNGKYNTYGTYKTKIINVLDEFPICTLNCTFVDKPYSYDNDRVTGIIKNYPNITAKSYEQFCKDINTVRSKVGLDPYGLFESASVGSPMTAELWQHVVYAIYAMDNSLTLPFVDRGYQITTEFIEKIETDLQNIRDNYW